MLTVAVMNANLDGTVLIVFSDVKHHAEIQDV